MIGPSPELSVRNSFLESLRTSDEMFGAEGRPLHALEKDRDRESLRPQ